MDWLVSMMVSLFQSIFVLQPGKVILVAAFSAIIWKKHEDDDVGVDLFTDPATGKYFKGRGEGEDARFQAVNWFQALSHLHFGFCQDSRQ